MAERKKIFEHLVSALWLRPESALWYAHMLAAAKTFSAHCLPEPSLDFGCMDGLNSFVLMGGIPPAEFDVFDEVIADAEAHRRSSLRDDYYDFAAAETRWDLDPPPQRFSIGVDWKAAHITKAARFFVHQTLMLWEPGTALQDVEDHSIGGIWAPNIYWMENVAQILAEFSRIVRPGGRIITMGPDVTLTSHMLYAHRTNFDEAWLADLDRGRHVNASRNGRSLSDWSRLFERSRLNIVAHQGFVPLALNAVYEIGFRPMFVPLIEMRRQLLEISRQDLLAVKMAWLERLHELAAPFLDDKVLNGLGSATLWHMFALTPGKAG